MGRPSTESTPPLNQLPKNLAEVIMSATAIYPIPNLVLIRPWGCLLWLTILLGSHTVGVRALHNGRLVCRLSVCLSRVNSDLEN